MTPTKEEFDQWRHSAVGRWYFEHVLQTYTDAAAQENGRSVGNLEATREQDYMVHVRNAGHIEGVEYAISLDPFEEERNEAESKWEELIGSP